MTRKDARERPGALFARRTKEGMEPDDLLCSRNARLPKALVGRAQWEINQAPSLGDMEQGWKEHLFHSMRAIEDRLGYPLTGIRDWENARSDSEDPSETSLREMRSGGSKEVVAATIDWSYVRCTGRSGLLIGFYFVRVSHTTATG